MVNQPAPWRQAVTWRLDRDLVERVRAAASANDEPVIALVTRALEREIWVTDDWCVADDAEIVDVHTGEQLVSTFGDRDLAELIVRAVNAHARQEADRAGTTDGPT